MFPARAEPRTTVNINGDPGCVSGVVPDGNRGFAHTPVRVAQVETELKFQRRRRVFPSAQNNGAALLINFVLLPPFIGPLSRARSVFRRFFPPSLRVFNGRHGRL